jgi:hypothetical protein
VVPVLAGGGLIDRLARWRGCILRRNPAQGYAQHQAIEACVCDQQIAATTQHKELCGMFFSPGGGLGNLLFACGLDKPARRAADAEGGERRKRLVFFDEHWSIFVDSVALLRRGQLLHLAVADRVAKVNH